VSGSPSTQQTGVVSAVNSKSITVGNLTCTIPSSLSSLIGSSVATGDKASIACVDGVLNALAVSKT
jgi:hypothetical protein